LPPDLVLLLAEALTIFDQPDSLAANESRRTGGDAEDGLADDRPKRVSPAEAALLSQTHATLAAIIAPASPEADRGAAAAAAVAVVRVRPPANRAADAGPCAVFAVRNARG
jgi:spore germination cell wall hydrolase CwlJ-like protein